MPARSWKAFGMVMVPVSGVRETFSPTSTTRPSGMAVSNDAVAGHSSVASPLPVPVSSLSWSVHEYSSWPRGGGVDVGAEATSTVSMTKGPASDPQVSWPGTPPAEV